MICYFCRRRYTPKHLCGEVVAYYILRRLFLNVLYDTQPRNTGELFVNIMHVIRNENLYPECLYIENAVSHYLTYFAEEFDVS